ncbi:Outer membrane protein TolC [Pseudomonas pohangensis]|jgi:cobalt-zinc-cadmium efflux system outer membrane protein|uniref:Outer membrane protein TolC n=1 Tax=Pseudomonas pohangensis TaxID=364197 RepID=A0A1H2H821_9PSED|nr:Outer membrane protein TolC [Pseudomonas pohangensis]
MTAFLFARRAGKGVMAAVLWLSLATGAQAETLSFARAQVLAQQDAPENLARQAQLESAQFSVEPADALPDPQLILGVDNVPVEGADRYSLNQDFMTMRRIGLMQEVPNSDKRKARRSLAVATVGVAEAEQREMLLQTRRQTALNWLNVYYAEHSVALFDQLDLQISLLRATVQSLIAGGSASPTELLQADELALTLEDRRDQLQRDVAVARAALRRWIGAAATEPLVGNPPVFQLSVPQLHQRLHEHPELNAANARVGEANAALAEAIAEKTPDWGVGFVYSNRAPQFGDMVSLQFTFDLPMFVGSRQGPTIKARQQSVAQLEAEQEVLLREHAAELESGLAELEQLHKALTRTEKSLIPLASQRAELELAAYKAGNRQLSTVINSRTALIEAQLREIELKRQVSELSANLYYAYVESLQ